MTGHAGWPMTCVLTPDGAPFFAGTFFPREQFAQLLTAITELWRDRPGQGGRCRAAGTRSAGATRRAGPDAGGAEPRRRRRLDTAVAGWPAMFDSARGGFGGAPKFPPSMVLEFLLRAYERTGQPMALQMVAAHRRRRWRAAECTTNSAADSPATASTPTGWCRTSRRCSTTTRCCLRAYLHWWRISGDPLARRIATRDGRFPVARSAHARGRVRVRARRRYRRRRGRRPTSGRPAAARSRCSGRTTAPTPPCCSRRHRRGHLRARRLDAAAAERPGRRAAAGRTIRARLLRGARAAPATGARRQGGHLVERAGDRRAGRGVGPAARAALSRGRARLRATLLLDLHIVDGRLRRTSRDGRVGDAAGVADDYGNLAEGLLILHQATADPAG